MYKCSEIDKLVVAKIKAAASDPTEVIVRLIQYAKKLKPVGDEECSYCEKMSAFLQEACITELQFKGPSNEWHN
jgi:hypothetical protein